MQFYLDFILISPLKETEGPRDLEILNYFTPSPPPAVQHFPVGTLFNLNSIIRLRCIDIPHSNPAEMAETCLPRVGVIGYVSVSVVPYGEGTEMTGWLQNGVAILPPSFSSPSLVLCRTHGTRGNLSENFRRAARRRWNSYDGGKV